MVNDVPAISVILPIYKPNILQLKEALDSVLEQSFENFECICIYDSPEDSLTKILNLYAENDSRFKVINGTNNGLIPALNLGLKLSKGKYIARAVGAST